MRARWDDETFGAELAPASPGMPGPDVAPSRAPVSDYGQMLRDRLAESLDPSMQERYKKRRADAVSAQDANYQGPEAAAALADGARLRALQAGMAKAANKFGSVMGDGGPKSDLGETLDAFGQADTDLFNRKQAAYKQAMAEEEAANTALTGLSDRQVRLGGMVDAEERAASERAMDDDPNSEVSKSYQSFVSELTGGKLNVAGVPASRLKPLIAPYEGLYRVREQSAAKKAEAEMRRQSALEADRRWALEFGDRRAARADAKAAREAEKNAREAGKIPEGEDSLRKEFRSRDEVKKYATIQQSYAQMQIAAGVPEADSGRAAADIAMVYNFMRLQDPTSTVRESEFATAENAGGVSDKIRNLYNRLQKGDRLPPTVRQGFLEQAERDYGTFQRTYEGVRKEYQDLAAKRGLNPGNVLGEYAPLTSKPVAPAGSPKAGDVEDGHRFKGGDPADPKNWEAL